MNKQPTISDIAKAVNVSKTTVSRYINGHYESMSIKTKKRIEEAILDLKYRPNNLARSLKSKKSRIIGIVANTLEYQVAAMFVRGLHEVCIDNGYSTIICSSDNLLDREIEELKVCISQQVDGIALIPVNKDCTYYHHIHENGTPIVMCNRYREDWKYDGVFVDNVALSQKGLEHLVENGYDRIALFTDNRLEESNKRFREIAFMDFISVNFDINGRDLLYIVEKKPELVRNAIQEMMNMYPDNRKAIFAINTNTLLLTLTEIKKLGLKIPEDIAVLGYDLLGWSDLVCDGISSLSQPFYELGVVSGRQLIKRIGNPGLFKRDEIWLHGTIEFRNSTKKY